MTDSPVQTVAQGASDARSLIAHNGHRHDMIGIKGVHQAKAETERDQGQAFADHAAAPGLAVDTGLPLNTEAMARGFEAK